MKGAGASYNQIMIFHVIAKEGSIRGAARKLEMAAPSVSQSLKLLETKLGVPLFRRSTRQMSLTEAGKFLLNNTSEALATLNYALEGVHDLSNAPSGKVSITVPRFVYQSVLRQIFPDFYRLYPEIELEISVSDTSVNIIKEGIDVGIRFGDRIEEGLVARQLTPKIEEALFASPEYLDLNGTPETPQDLENHKVIQYRFGASNRLAPLLLDDSGNTITVEMPKAIVVNDTDIIVDAAHAGLGIGRFLTPLMKRHFNDGSLVPVLEPYWYKYPGLYVYFSQNSQKARRIRVLVDFLLEKARIHEI
ncbi:LysR family transcriptional regulator [Vibrio sp. SCSIO 43137]|uniref:LysR family transcriptional regulator n=1 Tax=Vibrio sp. SCSIO 43137 TaxID=3021011 RepID=UPI00230813B5|nr:LysR family transcriptional regulator [Vibrio sp. SCSIO 43137]WCE31834.1 LysR family transcriptional regulator [Vibrio sp. SCSIO 43137]